MNKLCVCLTSLLLAACGGGGSESNVSPTPVVQPPAPEVFTGRFVDSPVQGLAFEMGDDHGVTNENGEFTYMAGNDVTFSIGSIVFPQIPAQELITPLEVFSTNDPEDIQVVNAIRLLQSLDADGEPGNGIEIPEQAHELAQDLSLDFADESFETLANNYLASLGLVHTMLIPAEQAAYHFRQTLSELSYAFDQNCDTEIVHEKVGYSGTFQTFAHNVAGSARIIDNCTIEITNFTYDGQGPDVYFYGSPTEEFSDTDAFAIGNAINGTVYDNANLIIKLAEGKTLDDLSSLSVWCVAFGADFGSLTFTP